MTTSITTATILGPDTFRAMPWRNGLGTTIELLKQDLPDGDGFAWRLSMADVTTDGEFSNFSGYDRTLLLLEGNGLMLDCDGVRQRLDKPLQAARFRGEDSTFATLPDGPVRDFNIMTQRQHCAARVTSAVHPTESTINVAADILMVYAVDGELAMNGDGFAELKLPAGHLCVLRSPATASLHCSGASHILIQISHHRSPA
jgi:environmental stress-induced protein Ves